MTRRTLVYEEDGKYYFSQQFNGDKNEAELFKLCTSITANWKEIIPLFDGVVTLAQFKDAVAKAEKLYGYEPEPVVKCNVMPCTEQVWKQINGKLTLYALYDEVLPENLRTALGGI